MRDHFHDCLIEISHTKDGPVVESIWAHRAVLARSDFFAGFSRRTKPAHIESCHPDGTCAFYALYRLVLEFAGGDCVRLIVEALYDPDHGMWDVGDHGDPVALIQAATFLRVPNDLLLDMVARVLDGVYSRLPFRDNDKTPHRDAHGAIELRHFVQHMVLGTDLPDALKRTLLARFLDLWHDGSDERAHMVRDATRLGIMPASFYRAGTVAGTEVEEDAEGRSWRVFRVGSNLLQRKKLRWDDLVVTVTNHGWGDASHQTRVVFGLQCQYRDDSIATAWHACRPFDVRLRLARCTVSAYHPLYGECHSTYRGSARDKCALDDGGRRAEHEKDLEPSLFLLPTPMATNWQHDTLEIALDIADGRKPMLGLCETGFVLTLYVLDQPLFL